MRLGRERRLLPRAARRVALGAAAALASGSAAIVLAAPASATTAVGAQLSLTGIATSSSPTGGSVIGIHPRDTVRFSAATVPTAGLDALGLGGLLHGLLRSVTGYQVEADLSGLPGGAANTVLGYRGSPGVSLTFPNAGTYDFTWTAKSVTLLGLVPLRLNLNQLAKAGVKLNAANEYVGQVVVAPDPPRGGIGLQVPELGIAPKVGAVQVPQVTVPGVQVDVPAPGASADPPPSAPTSPPATSGTTPPPASSAVPPTRPSQTAEPSRRTAVVTRQHRGGDRRGLGPDSDRSVRLDPHGAGTGATPDAVDTGHAGHGAGQPGDPVIRPAAANRVDLAATRDSVIGRVPVVLAIIAILALAVVTAAYARQYLVRRSS